MGLIRGGLIRGGLTRGLTVVRLDCQLSPTAKRSIICRNCEGASDFDVAAVNDGQEWKLFRKMRH